MIAITGLKKEDIGRKVIFNPPTKIYLEGTIVGWDRYNIFVLYNGQLYPEPTKPSYLYWE